MAVVQSFGALQTFGDSAPAAPVTPSAFDEQSAETYYQIYRTQPNVRTVVDFVARNIAQLGIHIFRRVSDIDRTRLFDHELAGWLTAPNPDTTGYRLIETLMLDLGIYGRGYWLKVRGADRMGLVRLPPSTVYPDGWLLSSSIVWLRPDGIPVELSPRDVCIFRYTDPEDQLTGLSPLETLRQLLAEESASGAYRRAYWKNAAQLEGVITRPATAPKWTPPQAQSFREQWQSRYLSPGMTAILEDGMTFTPTGHSARDSEFTAARKLTREEVAAAYHVPLPMVGILDHASFSNIREQHKNLYQDCLGPSLEMLQQEIERQLLPECDDVDRVYVEFNISDKLKGSFEEQAAGLQTLVGRPVMTLNEGRARLNLPSIKSEDANEVALPLNMAVTPTPAPFPAAALGGGSSTTTTPPAFLPGRALAPAAIATAPTIRAVWDRQRARLDKVPADARARSFDSARWDHELARDLETVYRATGIAPEDARVTAAARATTINADTLQLLVAGEDAFSPAREPALYG